MNRAHNFSAGPKPPASRDRATGGRAAHFRGRLGLMELSHRSPIFDAVHRGAEERLRRVMGIPDEYAVLFLQGGASLQFHMTALNLLEPGESADFVVTGTWSNKAVNEARRIAGGRIAWDGKDAQYSTLPDTVEYDANAVYAAYTTNNTIYGTQFHARPDSGAIPLVADMSSDICSRPVDVAAHDLIYAGAQKNLGPSGVTAVIESVGLAKAPGGLPPMLDFGFRSSADCSTPQTRLESTSSGKGGSKSWAGWMRWMPATAPRPTGSAA